MGKTLEIGKNLSLLKKYSAALSSMMEDGSFYRLSFRERFKLVRRVKKLYSKLLGPVSALKLRHIVVAAGVLALNTACFVPVGIAPDLRTGGTLDPGSTTSGGAGALNLTPFFSHLGLNPYGIRPLGGRVETEDPVANTERWETTEGVASSFVDLDGDGDLDVVHSGFSAERTLDRNTDTYTYAFGGAKLTYQKNTGSATNPEFDEQMPFPVDMVEHVGGLAFADMDDDGDQDLWMATNYAFYSYGEFYGGFYLFNDGLAFFENVGDPFNASFEYRGTFGGDPASTSSERAGLAIGDIDGDGDLDIVVGRQSGIVLYENTGSPQNPEFAFHAPSPYPLGDAVDDYTEYGFQLALVDIDGDGDLDMVATFGYWWNSPDVIANDGDGLNPAFDNNYVVYGLYSEGYIMLFPQIVDLDGDGDLDVLTFDPYLSGLIIEGPYYWSQNRGGLQFFENLVVDE